jgi:hypothetical protein
MRLQNKKLLAARRDCEVSTLWHILAEENIAKEIL